MNKLIAALPLGLCLACSAQASDHGGADAHGEKGGMFSNPYVVLKGMYMLSGSVEHGGHTIKGTSGTGFGVDLGASLTQHVGIELALSQGGNDVEEHALVIDKGTGKYTSMGLMLTYTHHYSSGWSSVVKAGAISEKETLDILGVSSSNTASGTAIALGLEYALGNHQELVVEFEHAMVSPESPKGDNIFIGWKKGFSSH